MHTYIHIDIVIVRSDNLQQYNETFALSNILPTDTQDYYRYRGSLTSPPCYNSVIWTVFKQATTISEAQVAG